MKKFVRKRCLAAVLAAVMLLCGCSDGKDDHNGDIDLVGDQTTKGEQNIAPPVTTTTAATTTTTTEEEQTKSRELIYEGIYDTDEDGYQSIDPVEYKLWLKDNVTGESTLLYEHILPGMAYYENIQYAVTADGQTPLMIAYDITDDNLDIVTAYTPQYGELEILGFIDYVRNDDGDWQNISEILDHTVMVIRDGDHILRSFCNDKAPQFEELFILKNGIYDYDEVQSMYVEAFHFVYMPDIAKDEFLYLRDHYFTEYTNEMMMEYFGHTLNEFFFCPDCWFGYEYFIWADKDGRLFWYHPESGVNEPIELIYGPEYTTFIAKAE